MARRIGGFARRDSGVGGGGSGAFGAILEQGGGTLAARDAQPTRTDPTLSERPDRASDTWNRSLGGTLPARAATMVLRNNNRDIMRITFPPGAEYNGITATVVEGAASYDAENRRLNVRRLQSTSLQVSAINALANFPGTAEQIGASSSFIVQTVTAAGGADAVYYSQLFIYTNQEQGEDSNFSIVTATVDADNPAGSATWDPADRVVTLYFPAGAATRLADFQFTAALSAAGAPEFGFVGGDRNDGDDAIPNPVNTVIAPGQRVDFTGGRDAIDVDADPLRGLFIYDDDTDPSWELRAVERTREENAARSGVTINGANNSSLRILLGDADDQQNVLTLNSFSYLPETVNEGLVIPQQAPDNWTPRTADLDYNDVVKFRAASEGAAGNNLTVRMREGRPGVEAVTALGAVASLVDGGTRLVEVDWPESLGADANGRQVQVGAPRNIAAAQATAAIYGPTFNDRIGTATWYLPGSAINGIRVGIVSIGLSDQADNTAVGVAAGTLDNIAFVNVRVAGTVSYQDIIDAFNAIRVSGTQIIIATLDNGVDGTTTFDPTQNLGANFAGGVDGTADEASGTAYWSRAVGLLYLASDGTVTAAQAVTAINAARTGATASVDTEATNNNIRFTAVQSGALGNGIQIVISRGSGYTVSVSGRVITVTYPNVASSSGTLIDTINGNTDAAALITASAIDSTVNFNSNRYVGTFTTRGGADGFDGMAALVAQGVSGTVVPNQTVTASGGVTAAPAQPRTPLAVRERNAQGNRQLLITGIVPNVDTVGVLRAAYTDTTKAFEIIALGANQDYVLTTTSGTGTVLLNTNLTGGRDMGTRPELVFSVIGQSDGDIIVNFLNLIGSDYDTSLQTTLAQVRAALESLAYMRGQIDFIETGDQSNSIATPYPTGLIGGRNYVAPSPIEFLKRGEDDVDGKNIEVRYHADVDTIENLRDAALDRARNPEDVKVILISGTNIEAPPEPPPATKPMVPGAGDGSAPTIPVNGLTQAQVDARVRALVRDPALGSSNATWPDDKIPTDVARDSELNADIAEVRDEIPEVIDTLAFAVSGNMLTITAGQTGTASDIVATVSLAGLEDFLGEWGDIARGTSLEEGKTTTHNGRLYWVKVTHNRGGTGPDGDTTNYGVLGNNGGTYDGTAWYPAGTMVNYASAAWWTFSPVSPSDPNPDATTNTKWIRLSDNVDSFTGVSRSGAAITFTRESGTNPVTIAEAANGFGLARIGSLHSFTAGSANYQDTGIPLPTNPDDSDVFFFLARFAGLTGQGTLSGTEVKALTTVTTSGSSGGLEIATDGSQGNGIYAGRLANGNLAVRGDTFFETGDYIVGYEVGTTQAPAEEDDTPPLPVSRAEAIGIQNNENVSATSWQQLNPFSAAPRVLFGQGNPIIITSRTANTVTIARGVYTVFCRGNVRGDGTAVRVSPLFSFRTGTAESTEIARTDQAYIRNTTANRDLPFSLITELILTADTQLYVYAGSSPDQAGSSGGQAAGGAYQLRSDDFEIVFIPTGGSETVFYPREVGEDTFDLTGQAQNIALVDDDSGSEIIAPDTGYILATFDVPPLGLRGSTAMIRADRLRAARASNDLTSGLYTDANTHQIFYEVAAHSGGATSGNRILVEHIQTSVPMTPSQPVVDPAITDFERTSGNLSPPTGSIANEVIGYRLAISQPSHVASARIIGFAGAGSASRPSSFATLATVTDYHSETGTVTVPAGTTLADAGDIYTIRLEVYKTGQTPGTDEPIAYHDIRIVSHAPAAAFYHWGRFEYDANDAGAADSVARITDFTNDLTTGNTLADSYAATPDTTGEWQFYFFAKADETLPVGWQSGGLIADAAFFPPVDATRGGVDYRVWIMRPVYRRAAADGSINYEPRTS